MTRRTLLLAATTANAGRSAGAWDSGQIRTSGGVLDVHFGAGEITLGRTAVMEWIHSAAKALVTYYGRFPVPRAEIRVIPAPGRRGAFGGTTFPSTPPFTRISVGTGTTVGQLESDWIMTHELTHLAFPSVPRRHHWLEEGIATYVEPFARLQAGQITPGRVWAEMVRDMPKGQPRRGDAGLDNTHTWARTYWGGAIFCLLADVRIREQTGNRRGLRDALRGILDAGGNIEQEWPALAALQAGDRAAGVPVLSSLYQTMSQNAVPAQLDTLWEKLGVRASGPNVTFDDRTPLAPIRLGIEGRA